MHHRIAVLAAAILAVTAFTGCLGTDDGPTPTPTPSPDEGPLDPGPDVPPSTDPIAAPSPEWVPGEFWRWRVDHRLMDTFEVTTVVAARGETGYAVGVADVDLGLQAVVAHVPPIGDVTRPGLAWEAHDQPVRVFDFPITAGATWTGEMEGRRIEFEATTVEVNAPGGTQTAFQVSGVYDDGSPALDYTYSPAAGSFLTLVRYGFDGGPQVTLTLLDHGFSYRNEVTVLRADDQFVGGTGGPSPDALPVPSGEPADTFAVPEGLSHLVLANFMGGGPGSYQIAYSYPDGGGLLFRHDNPPDNETIVLQTSVELPRPGEWGVAFVSGGSGFAFAEAMGVTLEALTPGE